MSDQTFYVTTPIYYVNARPHIGHAYTTIVADVLARRHRLLGDDTFFLTGTDEHGQKIERSAALAGIPPQQFADQVSKSFSDLWKRMGITNNDYIRTTSDKHKQGVQHLFSELYKNGFIYLASYTGAYCVSDEAFVDAPVGTPCPDCGRLLEEVTEENFFFKLSAFQAKLIDLIESNELIITPDSSRNEVLSFTRGIQTTVVQEYVAEALKEGFDLQGAHSKKEIKNASIAAGRLKGDVRLSSKGNPYLPGALKDLSISRSSFTWGIPVPEPAASDAAQKHVIYVWLDALANYMTALGYGSEDTALFDKFWPANLHLVGKEITRFHCVYWPAFLLAAGLPLPKAITAHGWLLFEDSKMSKSKGNIVRTETILDAFGNLVYASMFPTSTHAEQDLFASDVLRYFLLREIPFGQDGSFSFDALITRYNADLANGYGNLVSRTLKMIAGSAGVIPEVKVVANDQHFMAETENHSCRLMTLSNGFESDLGALSFASALSKAMVMVTLTDGYITQYTPWKLVGSDNPEHQFKAGTILYTAAESIRIITALLHPILPYATARVWAQLGLGDIEADAKAGKLKNLAWGGLKPGTQLGPLGPIFPRADKGLANMMTDMENPTPVDKEPTDPAAVVHTPTTAPDAAPRTTTLPEPATALPVGGSTALTTGPDPTKPAPEPSAAPAPEAAQITIDDFAKIELRVAQILVAERIPKADKLLRLEVDLGPDFPRRQILSGIAEWYAPEDLIGRRIVVITNLAPRKMRGLESHGMLLAASHGEGGKPVLATFGEDIALGSRLK
jgi:methionyl-tRNA synthetase